MHLSFDQLLAFASSLSTRQALSLPHLLACATCRREVKTLLLELAPETAAEPSPAGAPSYAPMWRRLRATGSRYLARFAAETRAADDLMAALLQEKPAMQRKLIAKADLFQSVPLVLRLLDASELLLSEDPRLAEQRAHLALDVCNLLDPSKVPPTTVQDLRARGWLLVGHARAAQQAWASAEGAFRQAEEFIAEPESPEAASLCRRLGSVRERQGRIAEALALLERSARLFDETGEVLEESQVVAETAGIFVRLQETERAIGLLGRCMHLREGSTPSAKTLRDCVLFALLHLALGHPRLAESVLRDAEDKARAAGIELGALLALARAEVATRSSAEVEAERLWDEALRSALSTRAEPEAFVAALQLAALQAASGRAADLVELAHAIAPLFRTTQLPVPARTLARRLHTEIRNGQPEPRRLTLLRDRYRKQLRSAGEPLDPLELLLEGSSPAPRSPSLPPTARSVETSRIRPPSR